MKKILGVSFAAMLAVSPMMAMADPVATASNSKVTANGTGIASTSYVQGAYNAAIDVVAAEELRAKGVEGDVTNLSEAITSDLTEKNQDVNLVNAINSVASAASDAYQLKANSNVAANGNYIVAGTGVATNLGNLDTQLKTVSDRTANYTTDLAAKQDASKSTVAANGNYIVAGDGVATNLGNLDTQLKTVSDTVSNYSGDLNSKQDKSDSEVTAEALTQNGLTNGVDLVTGQSVGTNLVAVAKKAKANAGEITTLKGDVNTTGSVLKSIKDNAAGATYDNTTSGLTATTLTGAIDEVEGRVDTLETTVSGLGTNSATKEGVVATINHSTVTVYTDWNSGGTPSGASTVSVQAGGTNHNEYYATANATGVAQPEQQEQGGSVEP